jgi:hypothetical protein
MEEQGQREEMLVSKVETDIESKDKGSNDNNNNDNNNDDRIFLNLSL